MLRHRVRALALALSQYVQSPYKHVVVFASLALGSTMLASFVPTLFLHVRSVGRLGLKLVLILVWLMWQWAKDVTLLVVHRIIAFLRDRVSQAYFKRVHNLGCRHEPRQTESRP